MFEKKKISSFNFFNITLLRFITNSITNLSDLSDCALLKILLFGDQNYTQVENSYIINATIKYLVDYGDSMFHFGSCT